MHQLRHRVVRGTLHQIDNSGLHALTTPIHLDVPKPLHFRPAEVWLVGVWRRHVFLSLFREIHEFSIVDSVSKSHSSLLKCGFKVISGSNVINFWSVDDDFLFCCATCVRVSLMRRSDRAVRTNNGTSIMVE